MSPERRGQLVTLLLTTLVALITYVIGYLQGSRWHWGQ